MFTIYHDPGCIFSVTCLVILRATSTDFNRVDYKKEPFTKETLEYIVKSMGINATDLIQKKNKDWKKFYKSLDLTNDEIIQIMMDNPDLIERPIIVSGDKAIVGRPPKKLLRFMKETRTRVA